MLVWRKISTEKWADSWQERLLFLGWERLVITRLGDSNRIRMEIFEVTKREATLLVKRFGGEIRNLRLSTADWARAVVQKRPISIRGQLQIFNRAPGNNRPIPDNHLYLPAGLAFGTGDHATTAGCLRLLCDIAPKSGQWSVLDVGTGAGILAIAAVKFGASHVDAFDFDRTAVRTAKQNAKLNKLGHKIHVWKQDVLSFAPKRSYEIVTANLYSELLLRSANLLGRSLVPEGYLIASGVLRDQVDPIHKLLEESGMRTLLTRVRGKWSTLLARKQEPRTDAKKYDD
ncbi:MAG TPA: 50S ribosomal protein L11 methyltransferase [Chthoniobacterales bacterium]|nr:50S ribosomal protein L11 methyltransferase [Chthoniobacterales bacterium]